ncbi:MAG: hypothetical protein CMG13_01025 [Candidatus Marinimicrobia bacterium]|nr:hypothetical protein [Candidatus Neomarinimicrobiota bacterium]
MIARIVLVLVVALLAIRFYQYISQSKQVPEKKSKQKNFSSIKKDDVKDAEFEDIKGDGSV